MKPRDFAILSYLFFAGKPGATGLELTHFLKRLGYLLSYAFIYIRMRKLVARGWVHQQDEADADGRYRRFFLTQPGNTALMKTMFPAKHP